MNKIHYYSDTMTKKSFYDSNYQREKQDFYGTDPKAIYDLLNKEKFDNNIWECACGDGNLAKPLKEKGYNVYCTDIIERNYKLDDTFDFLECNKSFDGDIITNPPFKYAMEFILKALELTNRKVAMFGKIQLLESAKRYEQLFSKCDNLKTVYVYSRRINCYRNNNFNMKGKSSTACYCWFVFDKEYKGKSMIDWIY